MTSRTGWFPVARSADVGTTPLPVGAGGQAVVVVRLQCPAHGWRFDGEGRCVDVPSLGLHGAPPPRADLAMPWAVEERHGWVWLAPERTDVPLPPRPSGTPLPEHAPASSEPAISTFDNLDPSLEHAWHPVALSRELRPGGWLQIRLLGRNWTLCRDGDAVSADPPAFGVRERLGLIWLAPAEPADVPVEVPEASDRRFVLSWPLPVRSPGPAGPLADTFLDATHGPFVHAATIGTPDQAEVVAPQVTIEPGGFSAVQEQWCDNPLDPEVATGGRPLRQRRRTTYVYRAPFQLRLRQEFLDSGATTTILYLLQPEDPDSTRIYVCLLLAAGPGRPLPAPADVAAQVALQHEILEEDVRSQAALGMSGLPLGLRDEVHVPADRLGVALRQALCDFRAAGRRQEVAA